MIIITIDGPAASGKSTIARQLAQELDYYYLYSGLLYRAVAYVALTYYNYNSDNIAAISKADSDAIVDKLIYTYSLEQKEEIMFAGTHITQQCKESGIDQPASIVSTNIYVRNLINKMQRTIADDHNVIVDGRDAGSVVFSDAQYKFFLTASLAVRAKRWLSVQLQKNKQYTLEQAQQLLQERDARDQNRGVAPLIIPADAQIIDTTRLTIEDVVDLLLILQIAK